MINSKHLLRPSSIHCLHSSLERFCSRTALAKSRVSRCLAALPASTTSSKSFAQVHLPVGRSTSVYQKRRMTSINTSVLGQSGECYFIERVLQEKEIPPHRVCLASVKNGRRFIVKNVSPSDFEYFRDIYHTLEGGHCLRLLHDSVPEQSIFIYEYLTHDLLELARKDLPLTLTKRILRDALRGIATLHHRDIVHTDVKANNILIELKDGSHGLEILKVELADIEDGAYVSPERDIVGKQVGNYMWRSPEAHAMGRVNKPSDMFSFGVVCIYAMLQSVIFDISNEELDEDIEPLAVVLERQISYFADEEGLAGMFRHLGDNPWSQIFEVIRDGFNKTNPRKPFSLWKGLDADFKDLVGGMTNFDPAKRLTADEALQHRWFKGIQ
ncbi:hypothetical protein FH972_023938 [Carpinus fangiana]|uniref:Protein kinase domain-containing protein n=1 Tax=Carpinus fangiana TaxID=176857 RepID=A0A5N6KWL3_9ROSI|nr:hypothetical protein FH972_023938 [Carpinus fangiana]